MEKLQYKMKGHESFIIRDGWLSKGMSGISKNPKMFGDNGGADALGVGSSMAKSIRYWLKAARLMTENGTHGASLTDVGKVILEKDPYFEDPFSLWVVHSEIATNFGLATSWNLFFNDANITSFTREDLVRVMSNIYRNFFGDGFPESSLKSDCAAILSMYTPSKETDDPEDKKVSPFADLGLLKLKDGVYERTRPSAGNMSPYIVFYLLVDRLNRDGSIPIDTIEEGKNMPGKILNLNRVAINDFLDYLQNKKYITINRTCGLNMVYAGKKIDKAGILKSYYKGA